jgi:uncharacterized protein YoaH (UPF0181 family)
MKTFKWIERSLALVFATVVILVAGPGAAAAEQAAHDQIRSLVEKSQFSPADKAELLDAAGRALRAGIPADDVEIIITRGREQRVDAKTTGELLDTAARVQGQGLPVRPVLNRIEQGLSKGIPPERISDASRKLAEKLAEAEPIVSGLVRGGVKAGSGRDREYAIETVARALEKAVSKDAITGAGERVKERRGSVALFDKAVHTMTNLMDSGMSSGSASRIVHEAVKKGFSEKDLTKMEREVAEGLGKGKRIDDAVKSTESEIRGEGKKGDGSRDDRDGRRDEIRDDRSGRSRDSGSDRVRDPDRDRGGKDREQRENRERTVK